VWQINLSNIGLPKDRKTPIDERKIIPLGMYRTNLAVAL